MSKIKYIKYSALASMGFAAAFLGVSAAAVHIYTRRSKLPVKELKKLCGKNLENVKILSEDGIKLSGWFIKNDSAKSEKVVILLSGRGNNRSHNVEKAKLYLERGYSVLMPDLRATGKSEGTRITFGWEEKRDFIAWYYFLQAKGYDFIAAHGHSMGAASICYSLEEVDDLKFIVLESCYTDITKAVKGGLRTTYIPEIAAHIMLPMTKALVSFAEDQMHPGEYLKWTDAPLLVLGGDSEVIVPPANTKELFSKNRSRFAKLHLFNGAIHENFSLNFTIEFRAVVNDFLDKVHHAYEMEEEAIGSFVF